MHFRFVAFFGAHAAAFLLCATMAAADCPPTCPIPGGGNDPSADCLAEMAATGMRLNYPHHNPSKPKPPKEVRCFDGDPGCDLDGVVDNQCVFDIDVCLRNADPALPSCTPADVTAASVAGNAPELASLQAALNALLPATTNVCTSGQQLTVPLKVTASGAVKRGKGGVAITVTAGGVQDKDRVKLSCVPRNWPAHGYNAQNHRSSPVATTIDVSNVDELEPKWAFSIIDGGAKGVTATPTVDDKHVYVTSWNGRVYAIKRKTGTRKWSYDTGSAPFSGVQNTATLTSDGRLLVGDSAANVHCLNAKNGKLLWKTSIGDPVTESAHIWAAPQVVNDKVLVGKSSHSDQPCTRGELVALDLDTGAELWRHATVPEGVCYADTNDECTTDAECAAPGSPCVVGVCNNGINNPCDDDGDCPGQLGFDGFCITTPSCFYDTDTACSADTDCPSCIAAVGGGVTATTAADATGETVYMGAVGCFTFPSVGNSDAIFSLDADTGAVNWVHRTHTVEQFADGPPYHDYGFLNGPMLVEVDDGLGGTQALVVAGSKDGTIYALDRDTGAVVWTNELVAAPDFAGFGLFNAPVAFANGSFYAALFQMSNWPNPNDHLYSFNATTGATQWSEQIGPSWGATTVANGVLYVGTQAAQEFYAYDTATGVRLHTFDLPSGDLPDTVAGGAAIVGNTVYVPYGVFAGVGGVIAYELPAAP